MAVVGIHALILLCCLFCAVAAGDRKTILISCDAFRWDYLQLLGQPTPNIGYLISKGAYANRGIRNQYTTITLPNHVSLATGRNVDDHGIVGNDMYDPLMDESFTAWSNVNGTEVNWDDGNFDKDSKWMNNSAEPIWVTLPRQNAGKSAVMMWPFSSFKFNGASADYWVGWNGSVAYEHRIDMLISQLSQPEYTLGVLYFEELDNVGHKYGPYSQEIVHAISRIDNVIGYLLSSLSAAKLWPCCTNIIITADHGMTEISSSNPIYLPLYVDTSKMSVYDQCILPEPGYEDEVFRNLSRAPNMRIYHKYEPVPASEHFSHSRRIHDIVYFLDDGWYMSWDVPKNAKTTLQTSKIVVKDKRSLEMKRRPVGASVWGSHGYDNRYSTMWPIFVAAGPSIRSGVTVNPFNNTQIYCIICAINHVDPHPLAECMNEETPRLLRQALVEPPENWPTFPDQPFYDISDLIGDVVNFSENTTHERLALAIIMVSIGAIFIFLFVVVAICRLTTVRQSQRHLVIGVAQPIENGFYKAATTGNNQPVYAPHVPYGEECFEDSDDELLSHDS